MCDLTPMASELERGQLRFALRVPAAGKKIWSTSLISQTARESASASLPKSIGEGDGICQEAHLWRLAKKQKINRSVQLRRDLV